MPTVSAILLTTSKLPAELPDVRTSTPVACVERLAATTAAGEGVPPGRHGVRVTTKAGQQCEFDAVVLATHSDTALALLGDGATADEREVLGAIPYNRCVWSCMGCANRRFCSVSTGV